MSQSPSSIEILVDCLENGGEAAWELFVYTFQPTIAASVSRVVSRYRVAPQALIDDLVQETFLRLCRDNARILRNFESRHNTAIFGYIKVIATSVALDHLRSHAAQKRSAEVPSTTTLPEPRISPVAIEQSAMLEQIDCRLSATESKRDRTIFWLYYRQGFSAREIAELPGLGLTQKGVESCIHRLTNMLRAESGSPAFSVRKLEGKTAPKALGELE